jgi:hypothetical protein
MEPRLNYFENPTATKLVKQLNGLGMAVTAPAGRPRPKS